MKASNFKPNQAYQFYYMDTDIPLNIKADEKGQNLIINDTNDRFIVNEYQDILWYNERTKSLTIMPYTLENFKLK